MLKSIACIVLALAVLFLFAGQLVTGREREQMDFMAAMCAGLAAMCAGLAAIIAGINLALLSFGSYRDAKPRGKTYRKDGWQGDWREDTVPSSLAPAPHTHKANKPQVECRAPEFAASTAHPKQYLYRESLNDGRYFIAKEHDSTKPCRETDGGVRYVKLTREEAQHRIGYMLKFNDKHYRLPDFDEHGRVLPNGRKPAPAPTPGKPREKAKRTYDDDSQDNTQAAHGLNTSHVMSHFHSASPVSHCDSSIKSINDYGVYPGLSDAADRAGSGDSGCSPSSSGAGD